MHDTHRSSWVVGLILAEREQRLCEFLSGALHDAAGRALQGLSLGYLGPTWSRRA
jgi:hypothetical protein